MQDEVDRVKALRYPRREQEAMRGIKKAAALTVSVLVLAAGSASAKRPGGFHRLAGSRR
jgi:hypothetical protein